jgi:glycosyltransferase involved in cell wall biosynthesis
VKERRPGAFLRILTGSDRATVSGTLRRVGLNQSDFWVGEASPTEVPRYLRGARLGLSFRKPTLAQIAASPAKIPEYLAAGLPVVANAGIGDSDELLSGEGVGVVLADFSDAAYKEAAERALALADVPGIGARCRRVALQHFDLVKVGGVRYVNLYREVERQRLAAAGRAS